MAEQTDSSDIKEKLKKVYELQSSADVVSICVARLPSGSDVLLAGCGNGEVHCWYPTLPKQMRSSVSVGDDSVGCISHGTDQSSWYVGCSDKFCRLTLTQNNSTLTVTGRLTMNDEVNSIDVHHKNTFAAVADDSGCVTIVDLKTIKVFKRLLGHENICSSVKFRPNCPWFVVSGGLDCMLTLWDFKKGQAVGSTNMSDVTKDEGESSDTYVVNPPLIHSVDITSDGLIVAAGLENAKILLFTIGGKGFKLASVVDGHTQGVSCVSILSGTTMYSFGNDSRLFVWKLSTARAPGKTLVWASRQASVTHTEKASNITVSPDGSLIWIADESVTITGYRYDDSLNSL